jgi:hypothetical protein
MTLKMVWPKVSEYTALSCPLRSALTVPYPILTINVRNREADPLTDDTIDTIDIKNIEGPPVLL